MDHYLFFRTSMLTSEGVTWLKRLNKARIERDFGNLPHSEAYAVFRVWTNEHGTGVGIDDAASKDPHILESYLVEGLKIACGQNSAGLDAARDLARRRAKEWRMVLKSIREHGRSDP
jgi:hypothetical protein